jgi:hypothetical protein
VLKLKGAKASHAENAEIKAENHVTECIKIGNPYNNDAKFKNFISICRRE